MTPWCGMEAAAEKAPTDVVTAPTLGAVRYGAHGRGHVSALRPSRAAPRPRTTRPMVSVTQSTRRARVGPTAMTTAIVFRGSAARRGFAADGPGPSWPCWLSSC